MNHLSHQKSIFSRLAHLETSTICDASKQINLSDSSCNFYRLPSHIKPLIRATNIQNNTKTQMIGIARTSHGQDGFFGALLGLYQSQANEILFMNGSIDENNGALMGEKFATEGLRRGLSGIVAIGYIRDANSLIYSSHLSQLPIYHITNWIIPNAKLGGTQFFGQCQTFEDMMKKNSQTEIKFDDIDITVRTGDIVYGDHDGIITFQAKNTRIDNSIDSQQDDINTNWIEFYQDVNQLLDVAQNIQNKEENILKQVTNGTNLFDLADIDALAEGIMSGKKPKAAI